MIALLTRPIRFTGVSRATLRFLTSTVVSVVLILCIVSSGSDETWLFLGARNDTTVTWQPPPEKPLVAVCVTGGIRTLPIVLPSIASNFIVALQPDPAARFVFWDLSSKSDCEANKFNAKLQRSCHTAFRQSRVWLEKNMTSMLPEAAVNMVNIVDNLTCSHPFAARHTCCKRDARALRDGGQGSVWGLAQYVRKTLCYSRIKAYEQLHGIQFDLVAWIRPDLHFFQPVPPAKFFLSHAPRVYAMTKGMDWGDYIFLAPRPLAGRVAYRFDSNFLSACRSVLGDTKAPENRIAQWLVHDEPHMLWPFNAAIVRSPTTADCSRLNTDIIDSSVKQTTPPSNASTGLLLRAAETCQISYVASR